MPSVSGVSVVGRYLLCDAIGAGGMATVNLGRLLGEAGFSRTVAIKKLHPHLACDQEFVRTFLDEARLLARIRHPHVVAPLDVLALETEFYIVMEYVHGEPLSRLIKAEGGPIPPSIVSSIVQQTLLGLHSAHEATDEAGQPLDLVHRDVSPQNILVDKDGCAKVVDFGIAKAASRAQVTQEARLKGKLGYLAPEQLELGPTDRRTDIYTCGIVLWELLTGKRLFAADNPVAAAELVLRGVVSPPRSIVPELPAELDLVVLRSLALDPDQRFATAREMAEQLGQAIAPANSLEVSAWVEDRVGTELRKRNERILELDSVSPDELTLLITRRSARPVPQTAPGPAPDEDACVAGGAGAGAPAPDDVAPIAEESGRSLSPLVTHSTLPWLRPLRLRRAAWGALALGGLVMITTLAYERATVAPGGEPAHGSPMAAPSIDRVAETRAPLSASPPNSLPTPTVSEEGAVKAAEPETSARVRAVVSPRLPVGSPPPTRTPSSKPSAEAAPRAHSSGTAPSRRRCRDGELYEIDSRGVKRFRAECFL